MTMTYIFYEPFRTRPNPPIVIPCAAQADPRFPFWLESSGPFLYSICRVFLHLRKPLSQLCPCSLSYIGQRRLSDNAKKKRKELSVDTTAHHSSTHISPDKRHPREKMTMPYIFYEPFRKPTTPSNSYHVHVTSWPEISLLARVIRTLLIHNLPFLFTSSKALQPIVALFAILYRVAQVIR